MKFKKIKKIKYVEIREINTGQHQQALSIFTYTSHILPQELSHSATTIPTTPTATKKYITRINSTIAADRGPGSNARQQFIFKYTSKQLKILNIPHLQLHTHTATTICNCKYVCKSACYGKPLAEFTHYCCCCWCCCHCYCHCCLLLPTTFR